MGRRTDARAVRRIVAVAALLPAAGLSVHADLWDVDASIQVGVTYSDNGELDADNESSATSYDIQPRIGIVRDGPKLDATVNYRVDAVYGDERRNGEDNEVFHYLDAVSNFDFIENRLGVSLNSSITQQITDPGERVGFSNATRIGNLDEVSTINLAPYFRFSPATFTSGEVTYSYGVVEYGQPSAIDSKQGVANLVVSSAPPSSPLNWTLNLTDTRVEYDTGRDVTLQRAGVDFGYAITPRMDAVLNVGIDENDFEGAPTTRGDTDGAFWLAGIRGTIGANTTYEARAGEQFFGDSYLLEFNRTARRLTTAISYTEEATSLGSRQLDYEYLLSFLDDIGGLDLPVNSDDTYVSKRLNVTLGYALAKSSWDFSVFLEDRDYLTTRDGDGREGDGSQGVRLGWNWTPGDRMNVGASMDWTESELRTDGREPRDFRATASVRRNLPDAGFLTLRLWHTQRRNSTTTDEYEENGASLGFGYEF